MSWNASKQSHLKGIRNICRKKILDEVFVPLKQTNDWKVLLLDELAMKVLSICCKTEEILRNNVALIANLEKKREPLRYLSAIYIIFPNHKSVEIVISDFSPENRKYNKAHIFFLSSASNDVLMRLHERYCARHIKTVKEIDISFLPCESQVYSLDETEFFPLFFDVHNDLDIFYCENVAKKLVTLFSTLGEFPIIRYRKNFIKNLILAETIERELNEYRKSLPSSSKDNETLKSRCQLLILDRGFDCISPIIHEFTFQAMAYDLLDIHNDIYEYSASNEENNDQEIQEVPLTEDDFLWGRLRHEHIANVAKIIGDMFEPLSSKSNSHRKGRLSRLLSLGQVVKKHFIFKKKQTYFAYRHMANECMNIYCSGLNVLTDTEQNLATKHTSSGHPITDPLPAVETILMNPEYDTLQKIRILMLYIFFKKGILKKEFNHLVDQAQIPFSDVCIINNMLHFDIEIYKPGECEPLHFLPKYKKNVESTFKQSRWVPIIKHLMSCCITNTLSEEHFPFLDQSFDSSLLSGSRTGYWRVDKMPENIPRLIIFIAGGVTYSEMRCAYEVMSEYSGWEIYIGGDTILAPNLYMNKLRDLKSFVSR